MKTPSKKMEVDSFTVNLLEVILSNRPLPTIPTMVNEHWDPGVPLDAHLHCGSEENLVSYKSLERCSSQRPSNRSRTYQTSVYQNILLVWSFPRNEQKYRTIHKIVDSNGLSGLIFNINVSISEQALTFGSLFNEFIVHLQRGLIESKAAQEKDRILPSLRALSNNLHTESAGHARIGLKIPSTCNNGLDAGCRLPHPHLTPFEVNQQSRAAKSRGSLYLQAPACPSICQSVEPLHETWKEGHQQMNWCPDMPGWAWEDPVTMNGFEAQSGSETNHISGEESVTSVESILTSPYNNGKPLKPMHGQGERISGKMHERPEPVEEQNVNLPTDQRDHSGTISEAGNCSSQDMDHRQFTSTIGEADSKDSNYDLPTLVSHNSSPAMLPSYVQTEDHSANIASCNSSRGDSESQLGYGLVHREQIRSCPTTLTTISGDMAGSDPSATGPPASYSHDYSLPCASRENLNGILPDQYSRTRSSSFSSSLDIPFPDEFWTWSFEKRRSFHVDINADGTEEILWYPEEFA